MKNFSSSISGSNVNIVQSGGKTWINGVLYEGLHGSVHVTTINGKMYINGHPEEHYRKGGQEGSTDYHNGSGIAATETRTVEACKGFAVYLPCEVRVAQSTSASIEIEGDDNLLSLISTEVSGEILTIGLKPGVSVSMVCPFKIRLFLPVIEQIKVAGSDTGVKASEVITGRMLAIVVSGIGKIELPVQVKSVDVKMSGQGSCSLKGEATLQTMKISGQGSIHAGNLKSERSEITISGQGNCSVWVTEEMSAKISGMGNISYKGKPRISQKISGLGKINAVDF